MTSLLELCQSHTACSSIILTVGGSVHTAAAAAAGRHAAAAAGELLQLAGKRNDFLSVLPHHLEAEVGTRFVWRILREASESCNFGKKNLTARKICSQRT